MRASRRIALAGISAAFSTLAVIISCYIPFLDMTFMVVASLAVLLPIAKNDYTGAFLAYLATSVLSFLTAGNIIKVLPYIIFFGLHPIVLSLVQRFRLPFLIGILVKLAFCNLAIFLAVQFLGAATGFTELINTWFHSDVPLVALYAAGSLVFLLYDWLFRRLKLIFTYYIDKMAGIGGGKKRL